MADLSTANRDAAEECVRCALDGLQQADVDRASRLLAKAARLHPNLEGLAAAQKRLDAASAVVRIMKLAPKFADPYAILGVEQSATGVDIKKAYHRASLSVHPDKNDHPSATVAFQACTTAFNTLRDPVAREVHDRNARAAAMMTAAADQAAAAAARRRAANAAPPEPAASTPPLRALEQMAHWCRLPELKWICRHKCGLASSYGNKPDFVARIIGWVVERVGGPGADARGAYNLMRQLCTEARSASSLPPDEAAAKEAEMRRQAQERLAETARREAEARRAAEERAAAERAAAERVAAERAAAVMQRAAAERAAAIAALHVQAQAQAQAQAQRAAETLPKHQPPPAAASAEQPARRSLLPSACSAARRQQEPETPAVAAGSVAAGSGVQAGKRSAPDMVDLTGDCGAGDGETKGEAAGGKRRRRMPTATNLKQTGIRSFFGSPTKSPVASSPAPPPPPTSAPPPPPPPPHAQEQPPQPPPPQPQRQPLEPGVVELD